MKKVSILAATLLASTVGFSQISIDPEVGVNFSNIRTKVGNNDAVSADAKAGLRAGIGVNFDLYQGLYLRPGVYYNMQGAQSDVAGVKSATTLHYLEVPVNIGYRYTISENAGNIFAEAGPYLGYALAGSTKAEVLGIEGKHDVEFGDGVAEMNPLDWGFKFGLGYETPWGIYVKGSYGLGLGNGSNVKEVTSTNNTWNVSLGYRIQL